ADVRDGRADLSIADTYRRVQPRLPAIIAAGLLAGLGIILGLILFVVPGLFLLTIWSLIIPAIVLEGKSAGDAFGRSRELVRGNGWSVFGVIVLSVLVVIGVAIVVGIATFWLPDTSQAFVQNLIQNTLAYPFFALTLTLTYFALAGRATAAEPAMTMPPPPPAPPPPA
ncbi:MAG TPA: glycerophosphoryl diester phosphodiesterase membrane domain-containing protein, partial [Gaiellaceae bacterium]|nr:glycerophosphoryl diester phosphodiesterase membrane domain-containing protein [Gaiellaceae bacterium]